MWCVYVLPNINTAKAIAARLTIRKVAPMYVKHVLEHYTLEMRKTDALERQDLSRSYLAHHELESLVIIIIIINQ